MKLQTTNQSIHFILTEEKNPTGEFPDTFAEVVAIIGNTITEVGGPKSILNLASPIKIHKLKRASFDGKVEFGRK